MPNLEKSRNYIRMNFCRLRIETKLLKYTYNRVLKKRVSCSINCIQMKIIVFYL